MLFLVSPFLLPPPFHLLLLLFNVNTGELNQALMLANKHLPTELCLPSPDLEIFTIKKEIQERKLIVVVLVPRK